MRVIDKNIFGEEISLNDSNLYKEKRSKVARMTRTLYDYFMLDIFNDLPTVGNAQMPVLRPMCANFEVPKEMVAFDEAFAKDRTDCVVHFYTDDRRFLRIFRNPKKYLHFLKECVAVIEPDLSQYVNMPYALRQAHAWLNRAFAAWLQNQGVKIIQNVTWSLKDSYEYSLQGRARNTIIAVNCTGIIGHDFSKYLWNEGYKNVALALNPTKILRYGDIMPNEMTDISVYFDNLNLNCLRNGSKR